MDKIERLYKKLLTLEGPNKSSNGKINLKIRTELYKKIISDMETLRKRQAKFDIDSHAYFALDYRIRTRILKEIQIIMDEYIISKKTGNLSEWENMYGNIEDYIRDFFYFRIDKNYEKDRKVLADYKMIG